MDNGAAREVNRLPNVSNLSFVEDLYAEYLIDSRRVPTEWQEYFAQLAKDDPFAVRARTERGLAAPMGGRVELPAAMLLPSARHPALRETPEAESARAFELQDRVDQLLRAYRTRGHRIARIDPLGRERPAPAELDPKFYGFTDADWERRFSCETVCAEGRLPFREILQRLRNTYCRSIGVEYMHIDDLAIRRWMQRRMERTENRLAISRDAQIRILTRLTDAVTFEEFIRRKFVGAKSFSLEGSESLIPLLDLAIEKAGRQGIRQIVMGMAHRGRLNVLANILGKGAREIFREFADAEPERSIGRGDVKHHLGHSGFWKTAGGETIGLSMCFNPSHLEFVNPVALGRMRAKQDQAGDHERRRGLALLIHGDAAFAAQGVVQETLNLSQLPHYTVGGALHVIVNNQIGFTTAPEDGRSSAYATDVGKMLQIPIFHVNGEDPEAVAQVVEISMDFRQQFRRDVIIDMYGYRRLGHNEGDEPSFTQPLLYRAIQERKPVREGYLEHLLKLDGLTLAEADQIAAHRRRQLEQELSQARSPSYSPPTEARQGRWQGYLGGPENSAPDIETRVEKETLIFLLRKLTELPPEFHLHPKLEKMLEARRKMGRGEPAIDWSAAEALALGSLALEGARIRLSGQDTARGTFSQRHSIWHDYETGGRHIPLQHLADEAQAAGAPHREQGPVEIINSPLSEMGALGFEYGYSLESPDALVLWEAQFGDFCNVAQVIIDQFMVSAEDKWHRLSGLVLLLPHGFEGQGPEHSSARVERFLRLAAEDNIQIIYPSTPAQYFHSLRRQVRRRWRKPLIVFTPKSLLRHPRAVSSIEDLAAGRFEKVLPDATPETPARARKIVLCSGKIFYELDAARAEKKAGDVALIRIEQLYPWPEAPLRAALEPYRDETPLVWAQEEPENMGAWVFMRLRLGERAFGKFPLSGVSRPASASPATGSHSSHAQEQKALLEAALS